MFYYHYNQHFDKAGGVRFFGASSSEVRKWSEDSTCVVTVSATSVNCLTRLIVASFRILKGTAVMRVAFFGDNLNKRKGEVHYYKDRIACVCVVKGIDFVTARKGSI